MPHRNNFWISMKKGVERRCGSILCMAFLLASLAIGQDKKFTIRVITPASTPGGSSVYIAGNAPMLGNWDPAAVKLANEGDHLWSFSTVVPTGTVLQFKLTRGTWESEAEYVDDVVAQNTIVSVRSDTTITLAPVTWKDISPARRHRSSEGGIRGTVKYHRAMQGEGLKYARDLIVWLPPSYDRDVEKRYQVLYMHDGQNVFDPATSFLGFDWRADEVADSLIRVQAIPEIIIVGINNSPDRMTEYADTPTGRLYARFVATKVKPFIDSLYRTKPSRENTGIMGSSMGGLVSMLFVMWYPEVFSKAGCLSSSIGFGMGEKELEREFDRLALNKNLRIYMDVGELERSLIPPNREFAGFLQKRGFIEGDNLEFFFAEGAVHNELAWAHRLWRPLEFLFGR
jgi:predicted alpha/beta superfamily hydrolase